MTVAETITMTSIGVIQFFCVFLPNFNFRIFTEIPQYSVGLAKNKNKKKQKGKEKERKMNKDSQQTQQTKHTKRKDPPAAIETKKEAKKHKKAETVDESLPTQYQNFIALSRYARWLPDEKPPRRETWKETVDRYISFMCPEDKVDAVTREELRNAIFTCEENIK